VFPFSKVEAYVGSKTIADLKKKLTEMASKVQEETHQNQANQKLISELTAALENDRTLLKKKEEEFKNHYDLFSDIQLKHQQTIRKNANLRKQLDRLRKLIERAELSANITPLSFSENNNQEVNEDMIELDGDLNQQFILVKNNSESPIELTGWKILNRTLNTTFEFPKGTNIGPLTNIKIYSGNFDAAKNNPPISFYWMRNAWDSVSSQLALFDSRGDEKSGIISQNEEVVSPRAPITNVWQRISY